jgi:hypothetical protein
MIGKRPPPTTVTTSCRPSARRRLPKQASQLSNLIVLTLRKTVIRTPHGGRCGTPSVV